MIVAALALAWLPASAPFDVRCMTRNPVDPTELRLDFRVDAIERRASMTRATIGLDQTGFFPAGDSVAVVSRNDELALTGERAVLMLSKSRRPNGATGKLYHLIRDPDGARNARIRYMECILEAVRP